MSINRKDRRKELGNTNIEGVGRRLTVVLREAQTKERLVSWMSGKDRF